ncbi:MAG: hypothetical protein HZC47_03265 [Methanobacterium sp.]|uniref:hypothetical protein n=1 Tax=Methanobacterium sp. TaxID=2164 RepID=UPI003D64A931|nr:hypothetical protein [Methanobacterium sp.]
MDKNLKIVGYGFLIWLITSLITAVLGFFSSALIIYEIISAATIAITVIMFSYLYLKDTKMNFVKEGVIIGVVWLIISVILDLLMIIVGFTQLSLTSYAMYFASIYVIIPVITIGRGYLLDSKQKTLKN